MKLPHCPKCKAEKLRATDMSPLWFPSMKQCEEDGYEMGIDDYVYMDILCDACGHEFTEDFYTSMPPYLIGDKDRPKLIYTTGDNLALNVILDSLEPTSDLHKSLKKVIESFGDVINNDDISTQPIKTNTMCKIDYSVYEVVQSLRTIEASEEMTAELRKEYGTDFDMIKACIKDRLIKPEAIGLIKKLAPICYKISGKVFLKGDSCGEHDFIGDGLDFKPVIELFDMTTEVNTGESYSFYVSTTAHFQLATTEEMIIVKNYLNNLK